MRAGNDVLHLMTSQERQRMRIDMSNFNGDSRYAEYDNFRVDSANGTFRLLELGTYSGTAGKCGEVRCEYGNARSGIPISVNCIGVARILSGGALFCQKS